jgi:hypothetical protein
MKKISLNNFACGLLHVVSYIFIFAAALDVFIIINGLMGNETIVENINNNVSKIFNYGSK